MNTRVNTSPVRVLAIVLGAVVMTQSAWSQDTKVSGYVFGDYYWVAQGHEDAEGRHGLWFRRIYLTLDQKIAENWSMRLRGEMNQPGDFKTDSRMQPYIKDVYVKWSNDRHEVYLGLSPTPTWELIEKKWGYRAVEKTPLDFYKFGTSRDIGIAAMGRFDAEGRYRYHVMLANGSDTGAETNNGKKGMLSLAYSPIEALTFEAYGDYEDRSNEENAYTLQGALFFEQQAGRIGLQFARHVLDVPNADDAEFDVLSVFGVVRVNKAVNAFARFDRQFQPNPYGDKIAYCPFATTAAANFIVGGVDIGVSEQLRFMPNIEAVFYDDISGDTPQGDVMPRVTFFYTF